MSVIHSPPSRRSRRPPFFSAIAPLILIATVVSMAISWPLLSANPGAQGLTAWAPRFISFVAHYFMLNVSAGLIVYLLGFVLGGKAFPIVAVAIYMLLQTVLLIDTKVFSIFHFHLNGLVWNILVTEGASDSLSLGLGTWLTFGAMLTAILLVIGGSARYFLNRSREYGSGSERQWRRSSRITRMLFVAGLCLLLLDKGMYAFGDLYNKTNITRVATLFPLYQPLTIKRFAKKVLKINIPREEGLKVSSGGHLNYPRQPISFDPAGAKAPNIVLLVVDGLRFDMLRPEIMPNLFAFSRKQLVFENHYSGGNGTRFGLFTLLYGIHGHYWFSVLGERRSPVLMDALMDRGYDFSILSSTRLAFPEFRNTAFVRIPQFIEDEVSKAGTASRDRIITEKFIRFLRNRKSDKPFFAFLFYDSTHQPYDYPPAFKKFTPAIDDDINYFKDLGPGSATPLRNRYKNAVYYLDSLIGEALSSLSAEGLLHNTIVAVTGDHGEEFYENGFFGHTSSFSDYQLKTVFVLHAPGQKAGVVTRVTSHLDFVPTVMEALGCVSPPEGYAQGTSLLGPEPNRSFVSAANWDTAALIDADLRIVFSTQLYNMNMFEFRNGKDYALVADNGPLLQRYRKALLDEAQRMSEFSR
ncbi:MAG: sulfatase-like hydrolase/transferase [Deltaproteobacteria bacterium]|nr:sulfatase-like hydrolase/transferase [Deltaproteobacteria bacterium]MDH3382797.1 sulfatase-like hydrolase/transferase [Deltaproteobacteria bacterium]